MTSLALHFVDPTIPGLSGRDLIQRAVQTVAAVCTAKDSPAKQAHRDFTIRHDLAHLDPRLLRDLGIDQNAA